MKRVWSGEGVGAGWGAMAWGLGRLWGLSSLLFVLSPSGANPYKVRAREREGGFVVRPSGASLCIC